MRHFLNVRDSTAPAWPFELTDERVHILNDGDIHGASAPLYRLDRLAAVIVPSDHGFQLKLEEKGANTLVNDHLAQQEHELKDGDMVRFPRSKIDQPSNDAFLELRYFMVADTDKVGIEADPRRHSLVVNHESLGTMHLSLTKHRIVIGGRASGNPDFSFQSIRMSRLHARLTWSSEGYVLKDFGSRNGTTVNGIRCENPRLLKPGDEIRFADVQSRYMVEMDK